MTKDELEVRILNIERRILALEMRLDATGVAHVLAPVCSGDHYWLDGPEGFQICSRCAMYAPPPIAPHGEHCNCVDCRTARGGEPL